MKPFCPECHGSGEVNAQGYLDCAAPGCTAAEDRAHMEAHLNAIGRLSTRDMFWEAYKLGQAKNPAPLIHAPAHVLDGCGLSYEQCAEIAKDYGLGNAGVVDLVIKAAFRVASRDAAPANNNTENK